MKIASENQRLAFRLVSDVSKIGMSKKEAKAQNLKVVRSIGTQRNYVDWVKAFLDWCDQINRPFREHFSILHTQEYLYELAEEPRTKKEINDIKVALETTFKIKLEPVESEHFAILKSRAYQDDQIGKIINMLTDKFSLSARICAAANLRVHELLTLRRTSELERSTHREWSKDLYIHVSDFVLYTVTGKGGLRRYVAIPTALSKELESHRVASCEEITIKDRKIYYTLLYDIAGGQRLSQAFSAASMKALGFSFGAHGLRHRWAQKRFQTLKDNGMDTDTALSIVSQEMGHFRPDIVLAYFR